MRKASTYQRSSPPTPDASGAKYNPPLRAFAQRLRARGKSKMAIICAVLCELIHIAFGILKHQQGFNPSLA